MEYGQDNNAQSLRVLVRLVAWCNDYVRTALQLGGRHDGVETACLGVHEQRTARSNVAEGRGPNEFLALIENVSDAIPFAFRARDHEV